MSDKGARYTYYICDVFTAEPFCGNPLAVIPDASGLSSKQMQQIAREFNFSETTFVLPPEDGHTRKVRIFTPIAEMPFAGHPNIGTAFVLSKTGELDSLRDSRNIVFEEKAGLVPIRIDHEKSGTISCELMAPERLSLGEPVSIESIAKALSLRPDDFLERTHSPRFGSVGFPFIFAELKNEEALRRCRVNMDGFHAMADSGIAPDIFPYVRVEGKVDIRARMFAPLDGVPEDPATGSANCALVGLLAHYDPFPAGITSLKISQGVEMGRPSLLEARAEKVEGTVTATWIRGSSVLIAEGTLFIN